MNRTNWLLVGIAFFRSIPLLIFVALVCWIVTLVAGRADRPDPVARIALQRNHQIENGDLKTPAFEALVGKYLKKDIAAGKEVTPDIVAEKPLPAPMDNAVAAIISIPLTSRQANGIDIGNDVQICDRQNHGFGGLAKIIAIECDERLCQVTVKLPKIAGRTIDPDALADAWFASKQANSCASPRP